MYEQAPIGENKKDWTGSLDSVFRAIGAAGHSDVVREKNDYYATDPVAADILCDVEHFNGSIWEPACGEGHLSERLRERGYDVVSTDLIDRGYGMGGIDFLTAPVSLGDNIVTNPPYRMALEFCEKALSLIPEHGKVAMFLKLTFLEGKRRKPFFLVYPPKRLYVSSSRILCAMNGNFDAMRRNGGSVVAYGWYVWEKGFHGDTTIRWVN